MRNLIIGILIILGLFFLVTQVFATNTPYKTICHHTPANTVTLNFNNVQSYNGHLGTPHSGSTYDTDGACTQPTVTPTPTVEVTPTPTQEPECEKECEPTPTPTEEPRVTPTPTEEPKVESHSESTGSPSAPSCGDSKPERVANINVVTTGNKGELEVQWSLPNSNSVHIEYGLEQFAQHALLNTPNDGHEVVGGLTSGQHYWFRVAGVNGCAVGDYSGWFDPIVP